MITPGAARLSAGHDGHRAAYAIGLDVGGTKIAGGVVTADGDVVVRIAPVLSPATDEAATLTALLRVVAELRARHPQIKAVGVGAAGLVMWPDGYIRWAPNNAYRDLPLRERLHHATGLPTIVDNDANVAAWAEARLASQASHMAFLTVGTGVGSGLILDRQLYRGKTGIGAEVGHLIVDPHGEQVCGCGNIGCLEAVASGTALRRHASAAAAADPDGMLATLAGGTALVSGETVLAAARMSDPVARALFERQGHWLGIGIASLVNLFDLELIVIGGGLANAGDLLLEPTRASFERFVFAREHRQLPRIALARLGDDAGWIGAAMLALDERPASPTRSAEGSTLRGSAAPAPSGVERPQPVRRFGA